MSLLVMADALRCWHKISHVFPGLMWAKRTPTQRAPMGQCCSKLEGKDRTHPELAAGANWLFWASRPFLLRGNANGHDLLPQASLMEPVAQCDTVCCTGGATPFLADLLGQDPRSRYFLASFRLRRLCQERTDFRQTSALQFRRARQPDGPESEDPPTVGVPFFLRVASKPTLVCIAHNLQLPNRGSPSTSTPVVGGQHRKATSSNNVSHRNCARRYSKRTCRGIVPLSRHPCQIPPGSNSSGSRVAVWTFVENLP